MSDIKSAISRNAFLTAINLPSNIRWRVDAGGRIHIDPALEMHMENTVYRYANPIELASLLEKGQWRFDRPTAWRDKYEAHIAQNLFGRGAPFQNLGVYAKCFTFQHSSEPIWRLSKGRVRLTYKLGDLIRGLLHATGTNGDSLPKLYVGRVRYMQPPDLRAAIDELIASNPKNVSRLAAPALLMKRIGFCFENEIRISFIFPPGAFNEKHLTIGSIPNGIVKALMINPYASLKTAKGLAKTFGGHGFPIARSKFDLDPRKL